MQYLIMNLGMARELCCENVELLSDDVRQSFLPEPRLRALAIPIQNVR
jgi:hypothetical protein